MFVALIKQLAVILEKMIVPIIILSLIFIGISYLINQNNAKDLLSGYNTMSDVEKQNFDIATYVPYFKKFNLFLGLSLFLISIFILYLVNSDWSGIFMGTYPIFCYTYFIWKSNQFYLQKTKKQNIITSVLIIFMITILGLILFEFNNTLNDNEIKIGNNKLEITGDYGCEIELKNIESITLENKIPEISSKTNGAALEITKKGYFNTKENQNVKLLINSNKKPIILITTKDKKKIFYSAKEKSNKEIYNDIIKKIN